MNSIDLQVTLKYQPNLPVPIDCPGDFPVGSKESVYYDGCLMNCEILSKSKHKYINKFSFYNPKSYYRYTVKVLEYPAKKRVKND